MGVIEGVLHLILIYFVVSSIFNYLAYSRVKKAEQQAAKQAEKELATTNPVVAVKEEIEMVHDQMCGSNLPKSEAYVLAKDGIRHYFCSWACREKFIAGKQM